MEETRSDAGPRRGTPPRLAIALDAVVGSIWLGGVVLLAANSSVFDSNTAFLMGLFGATAAAYAAAGTLIARRQPTNPIGWMFFALAALLIVGMSASEYAIHALVVAPGSLPGAAGVLALAEPTPTLFLVGLALVLYLFPSGRTMSSGWRTAATVTAIAAAIAALGVVLTPHVIINIWSDRLQGVGLRVADPFGLPALRRVGDGVVAVVGGTAAFGGAVGVASLFARRRTADATTREQLRWLAYVLGVSVAWIAIVVPIGVISHSTAAQEIFWLIATPLVALGPPIAVGIAIVRYRLFDVDVVINRTVVFGGLAVFITLVYVAIVAGVGQLIGTTGSSPVLSIVATAIVAVSFQPVRARVQRLANRLVYGNRATPYEVLSAFSERIGGAYASDELLPRMAEILAGGTGARESAVWIERGGRLSMATMWPPGGNGAIDAAGLAEIQAQGADLAVPVRHRGETLGALSIRKRPGEPVSSTERALVDDLAAQAGLVLRNVHLIDELRASRRRIVAAQDERAKKLERNIHDGAQQELVALAVKQRIAASMVGGDEARLREMLEGLQAETTAALENLRDLARGIYPPLLADKGLVVALQAQAAKAAVRVAVESEGVGRYAQEVEAAVYFCCLEALQNVAKYSAASIATVSVRGEPGVLSFAVIDDGVGFDVPATPLGTGLQGMSDRLEALGGQLNVESRPGDGTTVIGRVPADPVATEGA
jgi:signal transduction histidine kinase